MSEGAKRQDQPYTYNDYLSWPETDRIEILGGVPYMMASPNRAHQEIVGALFNAFYNYLSGKPCRVFVAPFGVRLHPKDDGSDQHMVEPDITVVCDERKLDDRGCNGAPDLVIEVTSPSTANHDRFRKYLAYQSAGVLEYWIVEPEDRVVTVNNLQGGKFLSTMYTEQERIRATVLNGFELDLATVFPEVEPEQTVDE